MIKKDQVVTMNYTVSTNDSVEIDSSKNGKPLVFLHGYGYLVPGLEEVLAEKRNGDTFTTKVLAEKAYGERFDNLVQTVPLAMFEGMEVDVGMSFRATTDDGEQSVVIIDVSDDEIVVDGNHPLAGIDLIFEVEILDVRDATQDEIDSGHIHGDGGSHH